MSTLKKKQKTQADYARSMTTALIILGVLGISVGIAYWVNSQFNLRQILQVPPQVPDAVIPIGLGVGAFVLLMMIVTIGFAPFFRSPKDELDEYGMFKHRGSE